jgi:hypothetical protein
VPLADAAAQQLISGFVLLPELAYRMPTSFGRIASCRTGLLDFLSQSLHSPADQTLVPLLHMVRLRLPLTLAVLAIYRSSLWLICCS